LCPFFQDVALGVLHPMLTTKEQKHVDLICRHMKDHELAAILVGRNPKKTLAKFLRERADGTYQDEGDLCCLADELDPEA